MSVNGLADVALRIRMAIAGRIDEAADGADVRIVQGSPPARNGTDPSLQSKAQSES